DLALNGHGFRGDDGTGGEAITERLSIEQFQHQDKDVPFFENVEDLADVGMTDLGQRSRLAPQALARIGAVSTGMKRLDSDSSLQAFIPALVNDPHSALAYFAPDSVRASDDELKDCSDMTN